jgi:hypothetical protein
MPGLSTLRRRVPWLMVFELVRLTHGHVMEHTSPDDRRRALAIVRDTKGDPRKVSAADRDELRRIAAELDLKDLARSAGPALLFSRVRRRR